MSTITITRNSRKVGYGVNTSPVEKWNKDYTHSHHYFEKPDAPMFEGTIRQVFDFIREDPLIRSLQSGGTLYASAFFVNGQRINTNSHAWEYGIDSLLDGNIDSLELPLAYE